MGGEGLHLRLRWQARWALLWVHEGLVRLLVSTLAGRTNVKEGGHTFHAQKKRGTKERNSSTGNVIEHQNHVSIKRIPLCRPPTAEKGVLKIKSGEKAKTIEWANIDLVLRQNNTYEAVRSRCPSST